MLTEARYKNRAKSSTQTEELVPIDPIELRSECICIVSQIFMYVLERQNSCNQKHVNTSGNELTKVRFFKHILFVY